MTTDEFPTDRLSRIMTAVETIETSIDVLFKNKVSVVRCMMLIERPVILSSGDS
jgi:hypothetical protein